MRTGMGRFRRQSGVALMTVLLVGSGLTAVSAVGAYAALTDLRSNNVDRLASSALAYAEAGIDRFIQQIRGGAFTFGQLNKAGCSPNPVISLPTGIVGDGAYTAQLTVWDQEAATLEERFPPGACTPARPTNPRAFTPFFQITSTGYVGGVANPEAKRIVRQVIRVEPVDWPIGVYGHLIDAGGNADLITISLLSETNIIGRKNVDIIGLDPYYKVQDFFPNGMANCTNQAVCGLTAPVHAAAHAAGTINLSPAGGQPEFQSSRPNCTANKNNSLRQSLFDSDGSAWSGNLTVGCPPTFTYYPTNNKFSSADLARLVKKPTEDELQALKAQAQGSGVYCSFPGSGGSGGTQCTHAGVAAGSNYRVNLLLNAGVRNIVAYYEYRSGTPNQNKLAWQDAVWPCSDDPAIHRSVTIIIRNGGMNHNGENVNGAAYMDGDFDKANGNGFFNGTVISNSTVDARGTYNFSLDACWVANMPGGFLKVVPTQWSEVDR